MVTEINLNNHVWVVLTREGKAAYRRYFEEKGFKPPKLKITKAEGSNWAKFQLLDLMRIFGPFCFAGGKNVVKDCVIRLQMPE